MSSIFSLLIYTAQKMKFSIKDLVTFTEEIVMENIIFCAVLVLIDDFEHAFTC